MQRGAGRLALLCAVVLTIAGCGGGSDEKTTLSVKDSAGQPAAVMTRTAGGTVVVPTETRNTGGANVRTATPAATGSPAAPRAALVTPAATARAGVSVTPASGFDYLRLEKYIPADNELPDRVVYQAKVDLGNEAAANDSAQLKAFQDSGRVSGVQFFLSVEAGARTISVGISYYNNPTEPRRLLRESGDPANPSGPNRLPLVGIGDELIAQRGQVGSGEGALNLVNLAWVRGAFFVSLFDVGGPADKPTDVAVFVAKLIDAKLAAQPAP